MYLFRYYPHGHTHINNDITDKVYLISVTALHGTAFPDCKMGNEF